MNFKKLLVMSTCLACGLTLASCGEKTTTVNVGLGYAAAFNAAKSQFDVTTAMVAFDGDKIVDARIDVVQVKVGAESTGSEENGDLAYTGAVKLNNTNLNDEGYVTTKLELGKNYNMVQIGHSVAEVDVQIESFADWTAGKTIAEVKAAMDGTKLAEGTLANCTINVHEFVAAIESAWTLKSADTVNVSSFTTGVAINSKLSDGNHDGALDEVTVDIAGTLVSGGKVVAAQIDAVYFDLVVSSDKGAVSVNTASKYYDETTLSKSKKTLGDAYNMKPASQIQKEWYEQAAAVEAAAVGKTPAEIKALVKGEGELANATMVVAPYLSALAKATTYADLEHVGPQA
ncbi:MAG: hypothetical protein MR270_01725 [Erysipelotrichaceae bacterium]|nr:hypothetical protein [Erysipelotrichaceae bacterium]